MMQSWARSGAVTIRKAHLVDDDRPTWEPAVDDTVPTPAPVAEEPTVEHEAPPPPAPPGPTAGPNWLWAALIGAVIGALVAGGLVAAFGRQTTTRTVTNFGPNSSKIVSGDVQSVLAKVEPGV